MIVTAPGEFLEALKSLDLPGAAPCVPRGVLLVMPEQFRVNPECSVDNPYMDTVSAVDPDRALSQAQDLESLIARQGIELTIFPGEVDTPDGVFPNNV